MAADESGFERTIRVSKDRFRRARMRLYRTLWDVDERTLPRSRRGLLTVVRLAFVTADSFFRERLHIRAAALAFYTVLSVVPLAAFVFSIAKGLGAYDALVADTVRPFLAEMFRADVGEDVPEGVALVRGTLERILSLIAETDVFGLGVAGLVVLVVTISRVMIVAEEAFDAIWGFPGERPLARRLPGWAAVALFTPPALVFASTVTAARHGRPVMEALHQWVPIPIVVSAIAFVLPPLLVCVSLLPLYLLLPSARVRRNAAAIGALVGGLGWYVLQVIHVRFQIGVARMNALYAGFGAFPIFLVWLHLSWVWVLLGAQVAAAHQNAPTLRQLARRRLHDHASRQAVALQVMVALAKHPEGERLRHLAQIVGVAVEPLREVLDALLEHGLLGRSEGPYDPLYVPTADPETMRVAAVLTALERGAADDSRMPWEESEGPLSQVLEGLESAVQSSHHNRTIGELKRASERGEAAADGE